MLTTQVSLQSHSVLNLSWLLVLIVDETAVRFGVNTETNVFYLFQHKAALISCYESIVELENEVNIETC